MYGMVSSHSGARARIKAKSFSPQASTEQPTYGSSRKPPKNFFQRIISFIKDAWYGITESNVHEFDGDVSVSFKIPPVLSLNSLNEVSAL
ncbi:unnamed protein product [Larinioides sclopetarius]|uniref:Uncharacterized protein n=1 Tax=Larinioides sclopetarius TaxID=280406 RepID=A0AAV1Z3D9_9ARAC